jgi:hypothetical protein
MGLCKLRISKLEPIHLGAIATQQQHAMATLFEAALQIAIVKIILARRPLKSETPRFCDDIESGSTERFDSSSLVKVEKSQFGG